MLFSILIPVRNDLSNLTCCLQSLRSQALADCEILVADDGSQPPLVQEDLPALDAPLHLFRLSGRGPAAARNLLANQATGDYLFFLDADTQASPQLLQCARGVVTKHPEIRSFFGSYDDRPAWPSLVSVYRNLLHHHTHQASGGQDVSTFWCGCGVIQRRLYLECGGLSEAYRTSSIEDLAFGARLLERGVLTRVVPELQVKHLKRWTLSRWLYTDLFRRGIPWVRLMRSRREWTNQLNVSRSQRVAALAAVVVATLLVSAVWRPSLALLAVVPLAVFVHLNRNFFRLVTRTQGLASAIAMVPLHLVYALICAMSVVMGLLYPSLGPEHDTPGRDASTCGGSALDPP
jgi:glycosyltransferase involved in cell wall biosynthesis